MHLPLSSWCESNLKNLDKSCNAKNRKSGEMDNCIYQTYNKISWHMLTICSKQHTTWLRKKCVHVYHQNMHWHIGNLFVRCCDLPSPKSYQHNYNLFPTIYIHVYNIISLCTAHGRHPFNETKQCQLCDSSSGSKVNANIYTIKEIFMMETSIMDFCQCS